MYKYILFPILFILIVSAAQAQKLSVDVKYVTSNGKADNSIIYYNGENKLTWDDFQGPPDNSVAFAALTTSGIGINLVFHSTDNVATMEIDVDCTFSKPTSWVKADKKNDYILTHEKHHFDITYIYSQIFVKRLREADLTAKNYQSMIKKIYGDVMQELTDEQTKYDDETQHSLIVPKQEEWNKKVDDELAALKNNP
jgi:hypothetical protein